MSIKFMKRGKNKNFYIVIICLLLIIILAAALSIYKTITGRAITDFVCINGTLSYWPLDGNASDKGNTGDNGLIWQASFISGKIGQAIKLDGIDDNIAFFGLLDKRPNWTFIAWINPEKDNGFIYSEGDPDTTLVINLNPSRAIGVGIWNKDRSPNWMSNFSSENVITLKSWNFIAITLKDGGTGTGELKFYVNGNLISTKNLQKENRDNPVYWAAIGANVGNVTAGGSKTISQPMYAFNGSIDEVGTFNRVLKPTEIQELYNSGSGMKVCTVPTPPACIQNWTQRNTTCSIDDAKIIYYTDGNNCRNNSGMPENSTIGCDYNNLGIIGTSISTSENFYAVLYINDSEADFIKKYTTGKIHNIKIKDEDDKNLVEFSWNFSESPLDINNIMIEKESESAQLGWTIVRGIYKTKKVWVDRLNSSDKICIRNADISSIDEMTKDCTRADEIQITCPVDNTYYKCELEGNDFIVSGLTNSGVREVSGFGTTISCTSSFTNCTSWGTCLNNRQTRVCRDINHCTSTMRIENNSCISAPTGNISVSCTPQWECSDYPVDCPPTGIKTKTCNDINNCGIETGMPETSESCKSTSSGTIIRTMIIILVVVIVIIIGIIIYMMRREKSSSIRAESQMKYPVLRGFR